MGGILAEVETHNDYMALVNFMSNNSSVEGK